MKYLQTKNVKLVLYSIIRQVKLKMTSISYTVLIKDGEQTKMENIHFCNLNHRNELKTSIIVMKALTKIKKELDSGKIVEINFLQDDLFRIYKNAEGYYVINNYKKILNYIVFELSNNSKKLHFRFLSPINFEKKNISYVFKLGHCVESIFLSDVYEVLYESISHMSYNIIEELRKIDYNTEATLESEIDSFTFKIINF